MKIDLNKFVTFEINGEQVKVKTPRVSDQLNLKQLTDGLETSSVEYLEKTLDWLDSLGLPKKYSLEMDSEMLDLVIKEISGQKKS